MNGHPQTITGKMLLGYSLEKNRHMVTRFSGVCIRE